MEFPQHLGLTEAEVRDLARHVITKARAPEDPVYMAGAELAYWMALPDQPNGLKKRIWNEELAREHLTCCPQSPETLTDLGNKLSS